jgi:hypothetical protein
MIKSLTAIALGTVLLGSQAFAGGPSPNAARIGQF